MRLEQEFASTIYKQVLDYREKSTDEKKYKQYGSMAYTLPILVRTAGLAQALAFVESKSKKQTAYADLLSHLAEVVIKDNNGSHLAEASRESDLQKYIYLTRRTMLALKWYKRFAESVLEVTSTDQFEEGGEDD